MKNKKTLFMILVGIVIVLFIVFLYVIITSQKQNSNGLIFEAGQEVFLNDSVTEISYYTDEGVFPTSEFISMLVTKENIKHTTGTLGDSDESVTNTFRLEKGDFETIVQFINSEKIIAQQPKGDACIGGTDPVLRFKTINNETYSLYFNDMVDCTSSPTNVTRYLESDFDEYVVENYLTDFLQNN